jgi:lambda repressor-like predicted transcriptional regulator
MIEELVSGSQLKDMPSDFKADFQERMKEAALARLTVDILAHLSEEQGQALESIIKQEGESSPAIGKYLSEAIPGYEKIVTESLGNFLAESKQDISL